MGCTIKGVIIENLFVAVCLSTIYQAVVYIHPMVENSSIEKGVCNISILGWTKQYCTRTGKETDSPKIIGYFAEDGNLMWTYYTYLSNNNNMPSYPETLFHDDGSGQLLIPTFNCSNATVYSTKLLLLSYLPQLSDVIDLNSTDVHYRDSFDQPVTFPCWYDLIGERALLTLTDVNLLLILPFATCVSFTILGVFVVEQHGDSPFNKLARLLLDFLIIPVLYTFHSLLYYIFIVLLLSVCCSWRVDGWCHVIPDDVSLESSWEAGSLCFPVVKLYRVLGRKCGGEAGPSPLPRRTIVYLSEPPTYSQSLEMGTVVPNLSVVDPTEIISAPPPSYEEVVRDFENYRM